VSFSPLERGILPTLALQQTPLSEPTTTLTTIPEISSVFELNSYLPQLAFTTSDHFTSEDALMDTDSSRARAAIALARAQLEHSRPASIHRKRERAANRMMMLPCELEEYRAMQTARSRNTQASTPEDDVLPVSDDFGAMRHVIQQSQSMVLTLMAAQEAISQRAETRKTSHSQSASIATIDLLRENPPPFPALYKPGDMPLCPPPSIPLPQLPSPRSLTAPAVSITPKRDRSRRHGVPLRATAYNCLPTEYDDKVVQHVDKLMHDFLDSQSEDMASEKSSRRRSQSSTDSRREYNSDAPNGRPDRGASELVRPRR
jgi:hypothetical protein